MEKRVFLSPSDHGVGRNACLVANCWEDKHTRPIAAVCARHLARCGVTVKVADADQTLAERCRASDEFGATLHVPIHTDAFHDESVRRLSLLFYTDDAGHRKLFDAIAPELEAVYPGNKKAVYSVRPDLAEVNSVHAPTVYCELGFHTNPTDCAEFIHDPETVGKALAKGICRALQVEWVEETGKLYRVQVGAFRVKENAAAYAEKLRADGYDAFVVEVEVEA